MGQNFTAKIDQKIERFKQENHQMLEAEVANKRITWLRQNYQGQSDGQPPSPRTAYELFFFEYLGLSEREVAVLSETDTKIVWASTNSCPTLAACNKGELDTKTICRGIYEKSTQAFMSQLDPQLRFHRSYEEIRPYSHHCKEMIIRVDFEQMMRLAIEEAKISKETGNKGYGAVVILGEKILGKAHDTVTTEKDPSLHAEVNAIRQATKTLGDRDLSGAILFSTCEPCPMCASLAVWANLTTIVYGVSIEETVRFGQPRTGVSCQEIIDRSSATIEVIGNVLKDECQALYI